MKITIFLCLLALTLLTSARNNIYYDGDKVKVDFYYESLCPYCQQFMQKSLKTAVGTKDFWNICDFSLNPYGNARRTKNETSWIYTCQHGVRQCEGNLIETCALHYYDFYSQALPFIVCLQENSSDWTSSGQRCATLYNMNWQQINTCAKGRQGNQLLAQMAQKTQSLQPPHTYVPWVVINGKHASSSESNLLSNMGPIQIDACKAF